MHYTINPNPVFSGYVLIYKCLLDISCKSRYPTLLLTRISYHQAEFNARVPIILLLAMSC